MRSNSWLWLALLGAGLFTLFSRIGPPTKPAVRAIVQERVVISAPIQLMLTGGDRFLAANMEAIRSAASGPGYGEADSRYRIRTHRVASQLNPCHEDNFYLGNALLTWGGSVDEGSDILHRAMECRVWDEAPPFFYGFNLHFFYRNELEASRAFEIAAQRSPKNYAALKKAAIMIASGQIKDDRMALEFLKRERDEANDIKLQQMLDKRIGRLEGLITLRDAQQRYENQFKRPLTSPQQLLDTHILDRIPEDPLGIGYAFFNGTFTLRQLKIEGLE